MSEVTEEEQALVAVKLHDNVRKLIREEVLLALEDYGFMSSLDSFALRSTVLDGIQYNETFNRIVKDIVVHQLQKP